MNRSSAFAVAALLAATITIDAFVEQAPPPAPLVQPVATGTSMSCPLAVDGSSRSFVHVANFGEGAARAKLTVIGTNAKTFSSEFVLDAGQVKTIRVSGRVSGRAAALVEALGGDVTASHSVWFRAQRRTGLLQRLVHPRGGGAAPCRSAGPGELAIPHLTTLDGDSRLALFNPGAASAGLSVSLIAGNRVVRPERLNDRVIPPRSLRVYNLGGFVFNAQEVTAVVRGRVVAEGLVVARGGVSLVSATEPSVSPLAIAGITGNGATLGLAALGSSDAGIAASVLGRQDQGRARGVPADLAPATGTLRRTPAVDGGGPAAFMLEATVGGPIALGLRWPATRAGGGDIAAAGQLQPGRRWAGAFGSIVPTATARVVIANPNQTEVAVRVRRLGGEGAEDLIVPGGRVRVIPFVTGQDPAAIRIEAEQPVAVLIQAIATETVEGLQTVYGFGLEATRIDEPEPVPLIVDPRAGVPAPLTH